MKCLLTITISAIFYFQLSAQISVALSEDVDCVCLGNPQQAFAVIAEGSAGPFTFEWEGPNGYSSTEREPVDIEAGGTYTLAITNAHHCTFEYDIVVPDCEGPGFNFQTQDPLYCDSLSGNIILSLDDDSTTYQVNWYLDNIFIAAQTQVGTFNLDSIGEGNYHVEAIAVGEDSCMFTSPSVTLTSTTILSVSISNITSSCEGDSTGAVDIQVLGESPFTFQWDNGTTTEDLMNVSAGTYEVSITDQVGCETSLIVVVPETSSNVDITANTSPPNCTGGDDGSITLTFNPPGNYGVNWDNGATGSTITGLEAGTYTAMIVDSTSGCALAPFSVTLDDPQNAMSLDDTTYPASCANATDGVVWIFVTGGTAPYTYEWGSNNSEIDDATWFLPDLSPGLYPITVTDAQGCSAIIISEVDINEDFEINIEATAVICQSSPDGSLTVTTQGGGTGNYSYAWSKEGDPGFTGTTATISNLDAGAYCVTLTDNGNGCTYSTCQNLERAPYPFIERVVVKATGSVNTIIYDASWVADANDCMFLQGGSTPEFTNAILDLMEQGSIGLQILLSAMWS
jgi:hypothetical protein